MGIFLFFPYITLVYFFCFKLPVTVFHLGMWYLGWESLVPYEIEKIWMFLKLSFFTVKGVILSIFFWHFLNITLVIPKISMACDLSFWDIFSPTCNSYDGNKFISFLDLHDPRWVIFQKIRLLDIDIGGYWYNHDMWWNVIYINLVCVFSTKPTGIMKIHFGHHVGKYDP